MANTIALDSTKTQIVFTTGSGSTDIPLAGNGVNLSLRNGEIEAAAAGGPATGDEVVYPISENPNIDVQYNASTEKVEFIGIVDTSVQREFSVANDNTVNVRRDNGNIVVTV